MTSLGGQVVSWQEYVEALFCRFGWEWNPLEELIELKQKSDIETYINSLACSQQNRRIIIIQATPELHSNLFTGM